MLVEFSVENYRSIKEAVTFSMVAATDPSLGKEDNLFSFKNKKILKSAAIYGANASGKSNIVSALMFMKSFVINSATKQLDDPTGVRPFLLDESWETQPSTFEIVFILGGRQYRYGFSLTSEKVTSEWLYHIPSKIETKLFVREESEYSLSRVFSEGNAVKKLTLPNTLFLPKVAQNNGQLSGEILRWFRHNLNIINSIRDTYSGFTARQIHEAKSDGKIDFRKKIVTFIKKFDLGIDNIESNSQKIEIEDLPQELREFLMQEIQEETPLEAVEQISINAIHKARASDKKNFFKKAFDLEQESEGTKKLFGLFGPLLYTLEHGEILALDEFDARLHPMITSEIVRLFNSRLNKNRAQLIVVTHDTTLLNNGNFRRDQIWFTEKDSEAATQLYSLVDFKVDKRKSYQENYLLGRYGAIPFIGSLNFLEQDSGK